MLSLEKIRYYQKVVEKGSFSEAAVACHISQSAISQHIKALEEELGVPLLYRHNRSFSMTPAGTYFYRKSLVLLHDYEMMCKETVRLARNEHAVLRIGYLKCYDGLEFQSAIAVFSQRYPNVKIQVMYGNHEDLLSALVSGDVDLVLNDQRRAYSNEYVNFDLVRNRCFIEIAAHHPLAGNDSFEVADLRQVPCILISTPAQQQNEMSYYRDILGFRGEFTFVNTLQEARVMVVSLAGFLPVETTQNVLPALRSIRRIPLLRNGEPVYRNYGAYWKKDNSGFYIEEFADILKDQFDNGNT